MQLIKGQLHVWTIYFDPRDYPGRYVVRRFTCREGESEPIPDKKPTAVVDTLEQARNAVPFALVRLDRWPGDESQIVESWL